GTSTIRIEGGARLGGARHDLWGDYIEAGSWAVVAAVTGGEIEIAGARCEDIEVVAAVLKRMDIGCSVDADAFRVEPSRLRAGGRRSRRWSADTGGSSSGCRDWARRSRSYREPPGPPGFFGGASSGRGMSTGSGSSASGASESRPTRKGRRSASVRSRTRMMC